MTEIKTNAIPHRLKNVNKQHPYVSGARDIYDDAKGKSQAEVNADVDDTFALHQSEINALDSQNYYTVEATQADTTIGSVMSRAGVIPQIDTIYRVGKWDGTQYDTTVYSEYAYNIIEGSGEWKLLDVKEIGIDDEPTAGSDNLVKSGGVKKTVQDVENEIPVIEDTDRDVRGELVTGYVRATVNPGQVMDTEGAQRTDYIRVNENDKYTATAGATSSVYCVAAFDNNKVFISDSPINSVGSASTANPVQTYDFTIPNGVAYIIISSVDQRTPDGPTLTKHLTGVFPNKNVLDRLGEDGEQKLTYRGEKVTHEVEEAVEQLDSYVKDNGGEINYDEDITGTVVTGYVTNEGVVGNTGNSYRRTDYISVNEGDSITVTYGTGSTGLGVAAFDASKQWISNSPVNIVGGEGTSQPTRTVNIVIPSGVAYIIAMQNISYNGGQVAISVIKHVHEVEHTLIYDKFPNKGTLDGFTSNGDTLLWNGEPIESQATISTLVVDLPVSDGTGIEAGYAYIDSTDYTIKVKQGS